MLYEIKVLKAPWPQGAKVGDVVDMPYLPVWAQGKCVIALDGAVETIEFEEPVPGDGVNRPLQLGEARGDGSGQPLPDIEAINADLADLRAKLAAAEAEKTHLQQQLDGAADAHDDVVKARDTALADLADLRAKLAAAEEAAATSTAASTTATKGAKK